ncbi:MAG: hypothetical protein U0Y10_08905 [Spirosomataceae bacterium]
MKALKLFTVMSIVSINAMSMDPQQNVESTSTENLKNDSAAAVVVSSTHLNASNYEVNPYTLLAQETAKANAEAYLVSPKTLWAQFYAQRNIATVEPNAPVLLAQVYALNNATAFEVSPSILMAQEIAQNNAAAYEVNPEVLVSQQMAFNNAAAYEVNPSVLLTQETAKAKAASYEVNPTTVLETVEAEQATPATKPATISVKLFDMKGELIEEKSMLKSDLMSEKGTEFLKGSFFSALVDGTAYYFVNRTVAL